MFSKAGDGGVAVSGGVGGSRGASANSGTAVGGGFGDSGTSNPSAVKYLPGKRRRNDQTTNNGQSSRCCFEPVTGSCDAFAGPMRHEDRLKGKICRW